MEKLANDFSDMKIGLQTPSRRKPRGGEIEEVLETRDAMVLQASKDTAACSLGESDEFADQKTINDGFMYCQSKLGAPKLKRLIDEEPLLLVSRYIQDGTQKSHLLLHTAAMFGNVEAVRIVLEYRRSQAWMRDSTGKTPLHTIFTRKNTLLEDMLECCRLIMEAFEQETGSYPTGCNAPVDLGGLTPLGVANKGFLCAYFHCVLCIVANILF